MGLAALTFVSASVGAIALTWLLAVSIRQWREPDTPRYLRVALGLFILLESILWLGIVRRALIEASSVGLASESFNTALVGPLQNILGIMGLVFTGMVIYYGQRLRSLVRRREAMISVISDGKPFAVRVSDIRLTPRELEVLRAIQRGQLSNEELSATLYVSPSTVNSHVRSVMKKAGVSSRRELMLLIEETKPRGPK